MEHQWFRPPPPSLSGPCKYSTEPARLLLFYKSDQICMLIMKCIMQSEQHRTNDPSAARPHPFMGCGWEHYMLHNRVVPRIRRLITNSAVLSGASRDSGSGSLFVINCILHPVTYCNITRIHNEHQKSRHPNQWGTMFHVRTPSPIPLFNSSRRL